MGQQVALELPYEVITSVASRQYIRDNFKQGTRVSSWIPFKDIGVRDGFNHRYDFGDLRSLADWIFENKRVPEPFVLDVLTDGRRLVDEGHRRKQAIELLISENKFDPETLVEFFPNKADKTELQRMVNQIVSNNHRKPLTAIEQSAVVFDIKNNFGVSSNQEIGNMIGVSRQTVDNLLLISEAGDDVKNEIKLGNMSFTDAVAFVRSQKRLKKQADEKEEESGQSSMFVQPDPKDSLRNEVAELEAVELQAQIYRDREANRNRIEAERLERIANHLEVKEGILLQHIGKRLAADATYTWTDNFADVDTGEIIAIDRVNTVLKQGELLDENTIKDLVGSNVKMVYVFKEIIPTASVFTEPVAEAEKSKYDLSRPELSAVQRAIQGADKIEAIVIKINASDEVQKEIGYQIYWLQRNLEEAREWIHMNKKQNKRGS